MGIGEETVRNLASLALAMRKRSYCPYSKFAVGAALLTADGKIYGGCNIENASFGPSVCAERTAVFKAVSEGDRDFAALAVCGGPADREPEDYCMPCGVCRQVLTEFCPPDFPVYLVKSESEIRQLTLRDLLPHAFGPGMKTV